MVEEYVKVAWSDFSSCAAEEHKQEQGQAHPAVLTSLAQI